jgi:uncharacterized protein (TIGR00255 family)
MIKSMTGYGKAEAVVANGRLQVEIRSVNHRYGEVSVKMPRPLLAHEHEVRKRIGERLKRGKIDVFVQFEAAAGELGKPQVNIALAKSYYDALQTLRQALGIREPISLNFVAGQRDVLVAADTEAVLGSLGESLLLVVDEAVAAIDLMRSREGDALLADLDGRLQRLAELLESIATRVPAAVATQAERLKERVAQLLGETALDEARISQEVAILADRSDVTEELVRFRSHLVQVRETLQQQEPVGRKLDFLMQELNREVNTIGSKANDATMAALVVETKAELEKIREQVQNVE